MNRMLKCLCVFSMCVTITFVEIQSFSIRLPIIVSRLFYKDYDAKLQRWQEMEKEVDSWTDALGLGIDGGIKKTVIVLNLLGFKTQQSCEGHFEWGRPY